MPTDRDILLQLIGSLTLAGHMGDVAEDVDAALQMAGFRVQWGDWDELRGELAKMNITTLHGTTLMSKNDD